MLTYTNCRLEKSHSSCSAKACKIAVVSGNNSLDLLHAIVKPKLID
jgi:hypothetical protein